jgi:hypothetical protein
MFALLVDFHKTDAREDQLDDSPRNGDPPTMNVWAIYVLYGANKTLSGRREQPLSTVMTSRRSEFGSAASFPETALN